VEAVCLEAPSPPLCSSTFLFVPVGVAQPGIVCVQARLHVLQSLTTWTVTRYCDWVVWLLWR
jgi:hypothetical protein